MATAERHQAGIELALLTRVRDLLGKAGGWSQGFEAVDRRGQMVDYKDPDAVAYCLTAAMDRALLDLVMWRQVLPAEQRDAHGMLARLTGWDGGFAYISARNVVATWNDRADLVKADVMFVLDAAIRRRVAELEHVGEYLCRAAYACPFCACSYEVPGRPCLYWKYGIGKPHYPRYPREGLTCKCGAKLVEVPA